jgi:hypothetical protein
MYGATIFNPGLSPYRSGVKLPTATVDLARQANLNTVRVTDFLDPDGSPATAPYDATDWDRVDAVIAAAGAAGMHVDLGLADYRNMMWNNCVNPYTANWKTFIDFVANRVNTITGRIYKDDPTIAFVSIAGEPLAVGSHAFTALATRSSCTISYTNAQLVAFYSSALGEWTGAGGSVLVNTGGLGYLNDAGVGIDWRQIMALQDDAFCDIKTYRGMLAYAPTVAKYCAGIGKPIVDEEFGWTQATSNRAGDFTDTFAVLHEYHFAGLAFWNLGYQEATTTYDVGPSEPLVWAAIRQGGTTTG